MRACPGLCRNRCPRAEPQPSRTSRRQYGVQRVVILGPGASGKSTLAVRLRQITGLPVIELDQRFWRPGLAATPPAE